MTAWTEDATTARLAQDNAQLLQRLAAVERKLDAVLEQAAARPLPGKPPLTYRDVTIVRYGKDSRQTGHWLSKTPK